MAAPRDSDLPVLVYHRHTIAYAGVATALAGTAIGFDRLPAANPLTAVLGVLETDVAPTTPSTDAVLAVAGVCQMIAGGVVSLGAPVTVDVTSRAFPAVAGQSIFGRALSAATVAGQKIQVLITREGLS